ncbi:MAG: ECF transporter S component [Firmicutes bacterium]|jgi:niacin transporter|nr:ECF transporter S component [Bacillota bacterium]
MKTREIVLGAVLTAFALLIPLAFGTYLRILIPPFSATLASHVPVMLAMLVSPSVAALVGVGSGLGFLMTYGLNPLGLMIGARALMHAVWGWIGGAVVARGRSFSFALTLTAPVHALAEAVAVVVVAVVLGIPLNQMRGAGVAGESLAAGTILAVVVVGTFLHHVVDSGISFAIARAAGWAHTDGRRAGR